jgi:hypothetical protein
MKTNYKSQVSKETKQKVIKEEVQKEISKEPLSLEVSGSDSMTVTDFDDLKEFLAKSYSHKGIKFLTSKFSPTKRIKGKDYEYANIELIFD